MSAAPAVDVLVLGSTGYTGKLIVKYLASHPERANFKLGVSARSRAKGDALLKSLSVDPSRAAVFEVDVSNVGQIEAAVAASKVVINAVGPFWLYSTPVIKACARQGKHYLDITGETFWIYSILKEVDTLASQSGAIIVPSAAHDSVPADLSTFLSVQTLQRHCQTTQKSWPGVTTSETAFIGRMAPSGGTLATVITGITCVPHDIRMASMKAYALSPVQGLVKSGITLFYKTLLHREKWYGSFYPLAGADTAIVLRSWGLFSLHDQGLVPTSKNTPPATYGEEFTYKEFFAHRSPFKALLQSALWVITGILLLLPPVRWWINKMSPAGSGPSVEELEKGRFKVVNVTRLGGANSRPVDARTEIAFSVDPGYLGTSAMISEAALGLLFTPRDELGPLARQGGLLTPATALGGILADRLSRTRFINISSKIVTDESQKTR